MFPVRLLDLLELKTVFEFVYRSIYMSPSHKRTDRFCTLMYICKTLILLYTVRLMINPAVVGNR